MIRWATLNLFNQSIIYLQYHLWIINAPSLDLSTESKSKWIQTCLKYHRLLIAAVWAKVFLQTAALKAMLVCRSFCKFQALWSHIQHQNFSLGKILVLILASLSESFTIRKSKMSTDIERCGTIQSSQQLWNGSFSKYDSEKFGVHL